LLVDLVLGAVPLRAARMSGWPYSTAAPGRTTPRSSRPARAARSNLAGNRPTYGLAELVAVGDLELVLVHVLGRQPPGRRSEITTASSKL
jgi:hypothetical protein